MQKVLLRWRASGRGLLGPTTFSRLMGLRVSRPHLRSKILLHISQFNRIPHNSTTESSMQATIQASREDYRASDYNKTASFVYSEEFTSPILRCLNPSEGDRIIDLGCGSGELTVKIQDAVGTKGFVVGVDCNEDMLTKASESGVRSLVLCDIQDLRVPMDLIEEKSFNAAFSNAALHWCKENPSGVLNGIKRVLKDGGRFICEMGGFLNCIGVRLSLHHALRKRGFEPEKIDPWYFPSVKEYRKLLEDGGFRVDSIALVPRITSLNGGGLRDWLELFVRRTFLKTLSDEDAAEIMDEVTQMCSVDMRDEEGNWSVMYARLRFSATLQY
ncbi:S-adenosyl-L-methionine-dependent methyltransferase [Pisolithus tinctorius]|nr:S-adenosyl-L-methionine-dependent methyltransferase [Pisolithus tinctorius]